MLSTVNETEVRYLQYALISAYRSSPQAPQLDLLIAAAAKYREKYQEAVFRTLASVDTAKSINSLRNYALAENEHTQKAAVKALSGSPSILAADILAESCGKGSSSNRILAARGLLQIISLVEDHNLEKKRALQKALPNVESEIEKKKMEAVLSSIHAVNNLALGKVVSTNGKGSKLELITDGEISKKKVASISGKDTSFQLDLGSKAKITALTVTFHFDGKSSYLYKIEASDDGKNWERVGSMNDLTKAAESGFTHHFSPIEARHFRISNITCKRGDKVSKYIKIAELAVYPEGEAPPISEKKDKQ